MRVGGKPGIGAPGGSGNSRQAASGRLRSAPTNWAECLRRALVAFTKQRREGVLADAFAPEMIGAVARGRSVVRQIGGIEIDSVGVLASVDAEPARAGALGVQAETALET